MGVSTNTYIMVGVALPEKWGFLPTDSYDDWHDRYGDLVIYKPVPGDLVHFTNIDAKNPHIGRVVAFDHGKWSTGTEFNEQYDVDRLAKEIDEVSTILLERFGITERAKLIIYSNVT